MAPNMHSILRKEFLNIISTVTCNIIGGDWTTNKAILQYINNQDCASENVDNAAPKDLNMAIAKLLFPNNTYQCPLTNTYVTSVETSERCAV